jgi:integrase
MARPKKLPDGVYLRGKVYYADFTVNGRRTRRRLSTELKAATDIYTQLKARADKGEYGLLDNDFPVSKLEELYLRHVRQSRRPATVSRYEHALKTILPKLAANKVTQIRSESVYRFRQERLAEGSSPRTINHDVTILGAMLRWGVKNDHIGAMPWKGAIPKLPHDHPKDGRPLTDAEVKVLLETSPQPWRDIWYAYLTTGLRKDELASLTFRDIDWESREIFVRGEVAKNHTARRVPIDAGLWAILERRRAEAKDRQPGKGRTSEITAMVQEKFSRDHVFVSTQNTPLTHRSGVYHAFIRCATKAGIETRLDDDTGREINHVDLHSLRRTFATSLIANGADPKSVQELLGHKTLTMTMNLYAKVNGQTKRQALGRLSYGQGALAPAHVVEYPEKVGLSVPVRHRSDTTTGTEG